MEAVSPGQSQDGLPCGPSCRVSAWAPQWPPYDCPSFPCPTDPPGVRPAVDPTGENSTLSLRERNTTPATRPFHDAEAFTRFPCIPCAGINDDGTFSVWEESGERRLIRNRAQTVRIGDLERGRHHILAATEPLPHRFETDRTIGREAFLALYRDFGRGSGRMSVPLKTIEIQ